MKTARHISEINASSMADIAFLLLIFFLVATTIKEDQGITVQLPPYLPAPPTPLAQDRVMTIKINAQDQVLAEKEMIDIDQLSTEVVSFLIRIIDQGVQPVVSIQTDRGSSYDRYIDAYDGIKHAYTEIRQTMAQNIYAKDYLALTKLQKKEVHGRVPMIISEAEPTEIALEH